MDATAERFVELLSRVTYKDWEILLRNDGARLYLQVQFVAADVKTLKIETQRGRKWMLSPHMTDTEVIVTAFHACRQAEEHECREAFHFRGQQVFSPHIDVSWIADGMRDVDVMDAREPRENIE